MLCSRNSKEGCRLELSEQGKEEEVSEVREEELEWGVGWQGGGVLGGRHDCVGPHSEVGKPVESSRGLL